MKRLAAVCSQTDSVLTGFRTVTTFCAETHICICCSAIFRSNNTANSTTLIRWSVPEKRLPPSLLIAKRSVRRAAVHRGAAEGQIGQRETPPTSIESLWADWSRSLEVDKDDHFKNVSGNRLMDWSCNFSTCVWPLWEGQTHRSEEVEHSVTRC